MSLDYDLRKVRDLDELDTPHERLVTQSIVFLAMGIGVGEITPKTLDEFFLRARVFERVMGAMMCDGDGEPHRVTYAALERRLGLHTNVGPETRATWRKRFMARLEETAGVDLRNEKNEHTTVSAS